MNFQLEMTVKEILSRNNHGVDAFARGDLSLAISELSEAFRLSKSLFEETSSRIPSQQQHCAEDSFQLLDHLFSHHYRESLLNRESTGDEKSPSPMPFVYRTAIALPHIPADAFVNASLSSPHLSILSVVLFNLSLSYHMLGRENLQKASKLYELAFRLQRTERNSPSIVYLMVIMNNLGHVHRGLGHVAASEQCFSQLLSMTVFVLNRRQDTESRTLAGVATQSSLVQLLEGFMNSTFHLILKDSSGAAPAA